jgi:hypothetical protein
MEDAHNAPAMPIFTLLKATVVIQAFGFLVAGS